MPRKKKRTFLERALEAIVGAFITYLSGSASDVWQTVLLLIGLGLVLHAVASD